MKKKILALGIIFVIIACMFSFISTTNAVTDIKITGNSVWRSNATTATINFISATTGTAYYKITESSTPPEDIVTGGTDGGSVTANTTKNISLTGLTSGAKYVHIVVKNGDELSNVLTIAMPYDVYYFDDFESYNENAYPGFFSIRHNGSNASNQKIITLNENKIFNAYGTYDTGLDERIQINPLSTGYAVFETDISASSLASDWYFGGIVIGPNYNNDNRNICVQINHNSKKFVSGENGNNHTSNILFEANKNYHVKMVLAVQNHKLDYYINNIKVNEDPINITDSYYTSLNWFGIYSGGGTVYYDNMKFYVTNTNPLPIYIVTFDTNGGNTVASQTIKSGKTATLPTAPTKDNYIFGGWYTDKELTIPFDFAAPITAPTTIYAKWNPALYTVTFNINGGSTVANQTIKRGETATLPTEPTKDNYTFGGWYKDATLTTQFDFTTPITAPVTIYAKWNETFSEKIIVKTEETNTTTIKGTFSGNPELVITKTEKGNGGYNALITLVNNDKEVIGSYDVTITGGEYKGELEITFEVGKQYEGDKVTVYHKKSSGEVEIKTAIVKDGKVKITVNELSPFMLVVDKKATAQKDITPKTGNNTYIYFIFVITVIAGIFTTSKLFKKK